MVSVWRSAASSALDAAQREASALSEEIQAAQAAAAAQLQQARAEAAQQLQQARADAAQELQQLRAEAEQQATLRQDEFARGTAVLGEQIATLEASLKQAGDSQAEAAEAAARDHSALLTQMEEAAAQASAERSARDAAMAQIRTEAEALRKALAEARQEAQTREQGTAILSQQVAALGAALRRSESQRRDVVHERQLIDRNYRTRVAQLSGMLDAVYKSTSWRVTGPMRSVVRRIRR